MRPNLVRGFIITTFVSLYLVVSIISTIHVIDFFRLSNPNWLAISLAVAFEIGAAASLASIIALEKMNKTLIWFLFILLTAMQMMGNTYFAFTHLTDYQSWVELFGLVDEEPIYQKRILSIISGAILPLVALGFIKSLVDYVRPDEETGIDVIIDDGGISKELAKEKAINTESEDLPKEDLIEENQTIEEPFLAEESTVVEEAPIAEEINTVEENPQAESTSEEKTFVANDRMHPQIMPGVLE